MLQVYCRGRLPGAGAKRMAERARSADAIEAARRVVAPYGKTSSVTPCGRDTFPRGEGFWVSAPADSLPRWRGRGTAAKPWWMRWSHSKHSQQEIGMRSIPSLSGKKQGKGDDSQEGENRRCSPSCAPAARSRTHPALRRARNPPIPMFWEQKKHPLSEESGCAVVSLKKVWITLRCRAAEQCDVRA